MRVRGENVRQAYLGFYWTLPVPRTGLRSLPRDLDAAARKSRTIRYQLEAVRRYVRDDKGELLGETAFMELAPDRGSEEIHAPLNEIIARCKTHDATLIYVDFAEYYNWRPHTFMMSRIAESKIATLPLLPDPMMIDGQCFDPVLHFRSWQVRHETDAAELRRQARDEVAVVMTALAGRRGGYQAAAEILNERGIPTATGRPWTADGVRKTHKRNTPTHTGHPDEAD